MKIAIEEERAPKEVVLHVAMRALLGVVMVGRGFDLLWASGLASWASGHAPRSLAALQPRDLASVLTSNGTVLLAALATVSGVVLMLGFMTRTAAAVAGALAGVALWNLAVSATVNGLTGWPIGLDGSLLQLGLSVTYMLLGGGVGSVDHFLHERARVRAIQNDNLWLVAPYVERPGVTE